MPLASANKDDVLLRTLLYGPAKTRKTWWAGSAAEAGYNVIYLGGENNGGAIFSQLSDEAQSRIFALDVTDSFGTQTFQDFVVRMFLGLAPQILWCETTRSVAPMVASQIKEDMDYVVMRRDKLTRKDVVVIDSWTALITSMKHHYAAKNKVDLADAEKESWDGYHWGQTLSQRLLSKMLSLPCHLIVIGHEEVYEKYEGAGKNRIMVSQRTQPISYSKAQGAALARQFEDVLYFSLDRKGNTEIDATPNATRDGGSRVLEPQRHAFADMMFDSFVQQFNGRVHVPEKSAFSTAGFVPMSGAELQDKDTFATVVLGKKPAPQLTSNKPAAIEKPKPVGEAAAGTTPIASLLQPKS